MIQSRIFMPLLLSACVAGPALSAEDDPPVLKGGSARADSTDYGYLGVRLEALAGARREALGIKGGVLIADVVENSPADRAGLKVRDVLLSVAGDRVSEPAAVVERVHAKKPGDRLKLEIQRGGERFSLEVTLGAVGEAAPSQERPSPERRRGERQRRGFLGVGFGEVPLVLAVHLNLEDGVGVLVGDVRRGSAAEKAGIVTHDVIVNIGGKPVNGGKGLVDLMGRHGPGDEVTVDIIHRGTPVAKKVILGERPATLPSPRLEFQDRLPPIPSPLWPRGPWRGRFKFGDEFDYEIPWGAWKADELRDLLERELEGHGFDSMTWKHLEEAFKDFDSTFRSTRSKVRWIEGDLEITVTREDGVTRITVKRDGEIIAADLPPEKIDTLPEDVQRLVRELLEKDKIELESIDPRRGPSLRLKTSESSGDSVDV